jgi:NADP-dependent 3-hydroxy acid dehydrogenase YdfG
MVQSLNRVPTSEIHHTTDRNLNGRMQMVAATLPQARFAKLWPKEQG